MTSESLSPRSSRRRQAIAAVFLFTLLIVLAIRGLSGSSINPLAKVSENKVDGTNQHTEISNRSPVFEKDKAPAPEVVSGSSLGSQYKELITLADPTPRQMYSVSKLLDQCRQAAILQPGDLEQLEAKRGAEDQLFLFYKNLSDQCKPVIDELSTLQEVRARAESWTKSAADAGFSLAELRLRFDSGRIGDPESLKSLALEALIQSYSDPLLQQELVIMVSNVQNAVTGAVPEIDLSGEGAGLVDEAIGLNEWDILYCINDAECDVTQLEEEMSSSIGGYAAEQLVIRAQSIDTAISERDREKVAALLNW